jgi:hypothetical protein
MRLQLCVLSRLLAKAYRDGVPMGSTLSESKAAGALTIPGSRQGNTRRYPGDHPRARVVVARLVHTLICIKKTLIYRPRKLARTHNRVNGWDYWPCWQLCRVV